MSTAALQRTVEYLRNAQRVVVLTGAGMSAESGVPTFRDSLTGLWARFDPESLATPQAFLADPAVVFGWYLSRVRALSSIEPHEGYHALVALERSFESFLVVTQNVDGLHARSGTSVVHELHGSLAEARCFHEGHPYPSDDFAALARASTEDAVAPPACSLCGSPIRPGVVWFGESLPAQTIQAASEAVRAADVVLLVGTASVVYPAAQLLVEARANGASVIEINPDQTPFTASADVYWSEKAGVALQAVARSFAHA